MYGDIPGEVIVAQIKSLDLGTLENIRWETALDGIVGEIDRQNG